MVTVRERFETAVAQGDADDAQRYATELSAHHLHSARNIQLAVQALIEDRQQSAWESAVDAREPW